MLWHSIFDKESGFLHSIGSVLADIIPDHFGVLSEEKDEQPNAADWNPTTRSYAAPSVSETEAATDVEPPTESQPQPEPTTESDAGSGVSAKTAKAAKAVTPTEQVESVGVSAETVAETADSEVPAVEPPAEAPATDETVADQS